MLQQFASLVLLVAFVSLSACSASPDSQNEMLACELLQKLHSYTAGQMNNSSIQSLLETGASVETHASPVLARLIHACTWVISQILDPNTPNSFSHAEELAAEASNAVLYCRKLGIGVVEGTESSNYWISV